MPSDAGSRTTLTGHVAMPIAIDALRHGSVGVTGRGHTEPQRVAPVGHREDELTAVAQVAYVNRGVRAVVVVPEPYFGHVITGGGVATHVDRGPFRCTRGSGEPENHHGC